MSTILIVDDHPLFRSGVATVLGAALPGCRLVQCESLESSRACATEPAVVVLDVNLPGGDGLGGIQLLRERWPQAQVLVVSGLEQTNIGAEALRRGARAFLAKAERPERLVALVRQLLSVAQPGDAGDEGAPSRPLLTQRQLAVLALVAEGLSNKAIGRRLGVSENTVRAHVQATLTALNATSRAEAAFNGRRLGLLP